jgi:hypothetical protein
MVHRLLRKREQLLLDCTHERPQATMTLETMNLQRLGEQKEARKNDVMQSKFGYLQS